jgi:hypothetical protein
MASCRRFEDLADVRLLKPVSADTLARHARPALATQLVAPRPLGMILAYPTNSEADGTIKAVRNRLSWGGTPKIIARAGVGND